MVTMLIGIAADQQFMMHPTWDMPGMLTFHQMSDMYDPQY